METYMSKNFSFKSKYFILDIDGTLIVTKSGRPSYNPRDENDWIFLGNVIDKLCSLDKDYSLILLSNQTKKVSKRYYNMIETLESYDINLCVFFLYKDMRKPSIKVMNEIPIPKRIRMSGDAISSVSNYPPYRYSNVDYEFYSNLQGLKSFTFPFTLFTLFPVSKIKAKKKEILILVGNPASGKSSLAKRLEMESNYFIESNDTHKNQEHEKGQSIVVDNTNPRESDRQKWILYSEEIGYSYRIVWFIRDGRPWNALRTNPVPEVAYNVYSKRFEEPTDAIIVEI